MTKVATKRSHAEAVERRRIRSERDDLIISMANGGATFREIAEDPRVRVSHVQAHRIYRRYLDEAVESDSERSKQRQLGRLEQLDPGQLSPLRGHRLQ